jgi:cell division septum initiation protein DivIVA
MKDVIERIKDDYQRAINENVTLMAEILALEQKIEVLKSTLDNLEDS